MLKKTFLILLIYFFSFTSLGDVKASETLEISGNGTGTSSIVTVTSGSVLNIFQSNTSNITNEVNSTSNTGGNSIEADGGGSIVTGNSTSTVEIKNITNQNLVSTPTTKLTPTSTTQPTPTQPSIKIIENTNSVNSGSSQSPVGGAPVVLGLSNTSGSNNVNALQVILGTLCISSALFITRSVFKS